MSKMTTIETVDKALAPGVASRELRRHKPEPWISLRSRRGALTLALLLLVQFLDFLDVSIVNVALPSIKHELGFSEQNLQWVVSGYVLTYGGFLLLGGRAADLVGRRRILVGGLILFALASLVAGAAQSDHLLIAARLAQGIGAAMMSPAALSILTTTFTNPRERNIALGAWAAIPGLAGASGVVLSGVLTQGPGWRWIFYLNLLVAFVAGIGTLALIDRDRSEHKRSSFDLSGAVLVTGGMLLLIYVLIEAPSVGWATTRTIGALAAALVTLAAFVANELRTRNPLVPLSIFRIKGLAAANATQLITFSGLYSMFFFLSLYMQNVLGYSPIQTGLAYLPLTGGFMIAAVIATPLLPRIGTKPLIVAGALIASSGLYYLSRVPVDGTFVRDLLPGIGIVAVGAGAVFTGVTTAATDGVPPQEAGIASGLLNGSMQFGGALGLAILSAVATARTNGVLAGGANSPLALTAGFQRAFLLGGVFALVAALIAFIAASTHADEHKARLHALPTPITEDASTKTRPTTGPSQGTTKSRTRPNAHQRRRTMSTSNDTIRSNTSPKREATRNDTHERTKGRALNRVLALLALCTLAVLTSATAAQAEVVTNETASYPWSGFVSCANGGAGELLTGTIEVHNLITSTVNGNVDSSQFQFQPHGNLVGRITGDTYQLTGMTRGTYNDILHSGEYTLTYVNSYQLIGPGPGNNLRVREIAHLTIDGDDVVVQHDDFSIECN